MTVSWAIGISLDELFQVVPVAGVQELQIFGRVLFFAVAQVGGQHRQGVLGVRAGFGDALRWLTAKLCLRL